MGRAPCCDKGKVKRGPWSPEEDNTLKTFLEQHGTAGNWIALPRKAGLNRCGKSCRLRWLNYLRPDIKHGGFTEEEDSVIWTLYNNIGSRWSIIASQLPGRTDNDVKNYWNTKLKKKLLASSSSSLGRTSSTKITENPDRFSGLTVPKIGVPDHGKSSLFGANPSTLPNQIAQEPSFFGQPISSYYYQSANVGLCEFGTNYENAGTSMSTSTTLEVSSSLSSSSTTLGLYENDLASWSVKSEDNNHGMFMEYMGIMGFDSSNDMLF